MAAIPGGFQVTKIGRFATTFTVSILGVFARASIWPSPALAQPDYSHMTVAQLTPAQTSGASALVKVVREATERFADVAAAEAEGYGLQFGCVSGPDSDRERADLITFLLAL